MMSLLKNVGKGVLYILVLPLFLLVLFLTAIYGIFLIVFMFFKSIVLFFTGRSLDDELPEDRLARDIKEGKPVNPTTPVQTNEPVKEQTIEEAVFGSSIEKEENVPFETIKNNDPIIDLPNEGPIEETSTRIDGDFERIETESQPVVPPKKEEPIQKYTPRGNQSIILNDEEEEEEDSGVTISYGDDDE